MTLKHLTLCLMLLPLGMLAQHKTYHFSSFQSRNAAQQWGPSQKTGSRQVVISNECIALTADKPYELNICNKTDLPDRGAIYLCTDEKSRPVTVMITSQEQMFVYSAAKRFLIHLDPLMAAGAMADSD